MLLIDAPLPTCAWSSLNATIGGGLRKATPNARSCLSKSLDEGDCARLIPVCFLYLFPVTYWYSPNQTVRPFWHIHQHGCRLPSPKYRVCLLNLQTEWETCQTTLEECALNLIWSIYWIVGVVASAFNLSLEQVVILCTGLVDWKGPSDPRYHCYF